MIKRDFKTYVGYEDHAPLALASRNHSLEQFT